MEVIMKRTLMLVCMIMIVYLQYGVVLFNDDFNRTEGSAVGNSWTNIGPVSPIIENSSMKVISNSLQGVRRDFTSLGITSGIYYVSYDWKITSNNWLADAFPNGTVTYLRHDYEGNLYYDNTSDFSNPITIGSLATNTWANFKLKVNIDTDRFSIWVNNTLVADNIAGLSVTDFTRFTFRAGSGSTVTQYIDNFIVYNDTPPATPTNLTAIGAVNDISLSWTGSTQDFLTYKIYRKTTSPADVFLAEVPGTQTNYIDVTAAANTDYFYRVKAVSMSTIESAFSNEVTAHLQPDISINPPAINITAGLGSSGSTSFTIHNNGSYPLQYSIPGSNERSVYFDGASDHYNSSYISLGNMGALQTFTLSMWVKPFLAQNTISIILDCHHGGTSNWVIQKVGEPADWSGFADGFSFPLERNSWQHLAVTFNNGVVKAYVNGVLVDTATRGLINYANTPTLALGNWPEGGRKFNGLIDELHVSTNIRYNGNFTPALRETADMNTFGLWHFDEAGGTQCIDSSIYGHHGTFVNSVQRSAEVPFITPTWQSVLSFNPSMGSVSANGTQTVNVTLNGSNLSDGIYNYSVMLVSNAPAPRDTLYIPVVVKIDNTPPVAPTGLIFNEALSDMNQIYLSWTANALADSVYSYKIWRRAISDTEWTLKGTVNSDQTWFIDNQFTGLDTTAVFYRITAIDWVNNVSEASEEVIAWLQRFLAPTNVQITNINDRDIHLTWSPVTQTISGLPGTPTCYVIYKSQYPSPTSDFDFLGVSFDEEYTHQWALYFQPLNRLFYIVTAYGGNMNRINDLVSRKQGWKYGELETLLNSQASSTIK